MTTALARSGSTNRDAELRTHLIRVARLARFFASPFGGNDVAYFCGLLHDLGKYNPSWQDGLARIIAGKPTLLPPHASVGAIHAYETCRTSRRTALGRLIAHIIDGHHKGLPDWQELEQTLHVNNVDLRALTAASVPGMPGDLADRTATAPTVSAGARDLPMFTRMLFSCLVDADRLHSERTSDRGRSKLRRNRHRMVDLADAVDHFLDDFPTESLSEINLERHRLLQEARAAARESLRPIYTMTAPTGLGKTFSSLAFATRLAAINAKRRVIYVAPFITVTEQTAGDYRRALGRLRAAVLEHHSHVSVSTHLASFKAHLARENWDSAVVVTTAVQFFESLYTNHPGRSRKLHRMANAVVILDEAQFIPAQYRSPIVHAMNVLAREYGTVFLLMTATQPDLGAKQWTAGDVPLEETPKEIVGDPMRLFKRVRRVQTHLPKDLYALVSISALADRIRSQASSSLAIMNTKAGARALHAALPNGTLLLTADMCGAHRMKVLTRVRSHNHAEQLRLVSTSLIEAGVDIDFPVVYRSLSGLSSLVQSAGRCNRHGRLPGLGQFHVVNVDEPVFFIRQEREITRSILEQLRDNPDELFSPSTLHRYSGDIYGSSSPDAKEILVRHLAGPTFAFKSASSKFKLIEDDQVTVLCPYEKDGQDLIGAFAQAEHMNVKARPDMFAQLQARSVTIRRKRAQRMIDSGEMYHLPSFDLYVAHRYDPTYGILSASERTEISG